MHDPNKYHIRILNNGQGGSTVTLVNELTGKNNSAGTFLKQEDAYQRACQLAEENDNFIFEDQWLKGYGDKAFPDMVDAIETGDTDRVKRREKGLQSLNQRNNGIIRVKRTKSRGLLGKLGVLKGNKVVTKRNGQPKMVTKKYKREETELTEGVTTHEIPVNHHNVKAVGIEKHEYNGKIKHKYWWQGKSGMKNSYTDLQQFRYSLTNDADMRQHAGKLIDGLHSKAGISEETELTEAKIEQHRSTAYDWHGGMSSPLYSFASTGGKVWDEAHREGLKHEISGNIAWVKENGHQHGNEYKGEDKRLKALHSYVSQAPIHKGD